MLPLFVFLVDDVQNVAEVDQTWRGHKDDLEHPEPHVGNGEDVVIARVQATRSVDVADHIGLFISPDFIQSSSKNHYSEDQKNRQPHFPNIGWLRLHFV